MILVVMGVTGCGKTSVGKALANRLKCPFFDADNYHPVSNREKLRRGDPLGDEDRWPWLRILAELLREEGAGGANIVLACSALKQSYRDVLASCGHPVKWIHVTGPRNRIAARLRDRAGSHDLILDYTRILDGQYRDLEPPADAIVLDNAAEPVRVAESALYCLGLNCQ